jgi:hypothetical protein
MAKKKKKNEQVKASETPVVKETSVVEEAPKVEAPKAKPTSKATSAYPAFTGGGYNDFTNWKAEKASWEAANG